MRRQFSPFRDGKKALLERNGENVLIDVDEWPVAVVNINGIVSDIEAVITMNALRNLVETKLPR